MRFFFMLRERREKFNLQRNGERFVVASCGFTIRSEEDLWIMLVKGDPMHSFFYLLFTHGKIFFCTKRHCLQI